MFKSLSKKLFFVLKNKVAFHLYKISYKILRYSWSQMEITVRFRMAVKAENEKKIRFRKIYLLI